MLINLAWGGVVSGKHPSSCQPCTKDVAELVDFLPSVVHGQHVTANISCLYSQGTFRVPVEFPVFRDAQI